MAWKWACASLRTETEQTPSSSVRKQNDIIMEALAACGHVGVAATEEVRVLVRSDSGCASPGPEQLLCVLFMLTPNLMPPHSSSLPLTLNTLSLPSSMQVEDVVVLGEPGDRSRLVVVFDPLDGSSNISSSIPTGGAGGWLSGRGIARLTQWVPVYGKEHTPARVRLNQLLENPHEHRIPAVDSAAGTIFGIYARTPSGTPLQDAQQPGHRLLAAG